MSGLEAYVYIYDIDTKNIVQTYFINTNTCWCGGIGGITHKYECGFGEYLSAIYVHNSKIFVAANKGLYVRKLFSSDWEKLKRFTYFNRLARINGVDNLIVIDNRERDEGYYYSRDSGQSWQYDMYGKAVLSRETETIYKLREYDLVEKLQNNSDVWTKIESYGHMNDRGIYDQIHGNLYSNKTNLYYVESGYKEYIFHYSTDGGSSFWKQDIKNNLDYTTPSYGINSEKINCIYEDNEYIYIYRN